MNSFYVYTLIDPRADAIFYVGKGTRGRISQHVKAAKRNRVDNAAKTIRILEILAAGAEVIERKVFEDLTELEAFAKEREMIAQIGLSNLTNMSPGGLTAIDRSKLRAKATLAALMPEREWIEKFRPTEAMIRVADRVRAELRKIAYHGQVSEIEITSAGVEFR